MAEIEGEEYLRAREFLDEVCDMQIALDDALHHLSVVDLAVHRLKGELKQLLNEKNEVTNPPNLLGRPVKDD
jgi:hypothetical protein